MLPAIRVWIILSLYNNIIEGIVLELEPIPTHPYPQEGPTVRSCSEAFKLTDRRNCCSIPYLLPTDVVEPCLQIPLSPIALEGENFRAECILNRTEMLVNGHFQLEAAMKRLTNVTNEDSTLTKRIQYAIGRCNQMYFNQIVTHFTDSCTSTSRHLLDCIFAITYRKCPPQYWTTSVECKQLVRALNNCPHFLVHSNTF